MNINCSFGEGRDNKRRYVDWSLCFNSVLLPLGRIAQGLDTSWQPNPVLIGAEGAFLLAA
jgi:hypothetical protein